MSIRYIYNTIEKVEDVEGTFADIWDELNNFQRWHVLGCSNGDINVAKKKKLCIWARCNPGSIDEEIYFKIVELYIKQCQIRDQTL